MALYKCECGKEEKHLGKVTIVHKEGKWVAKEALCSCGKYMDSEPTEGMPKLIRTEPTLTKKRDNLWSGAKEKLIGERGINEPFD
tara:strand:+ start:689 stop:943 length:255 start_codon:yes stop_codon:yes gene_type:complete